jgi:predicted  nucleic acid-binding Zn-ribbon protein
MKSDENNDARSVNDNPEARRNEALRKDKEDMVRTEGVRKGVITTSIIAVLILVIAGLFIVSHYKREQKNLLAQMETQKTVFTENVSARDSAISEWITTFSEIEKNIAMIKEKESKITSNSTNSELSTDKRQKVLEDIKYINTLLEQNKQKIAYLNAQLKKSGGAMKILESKISDLEASVKLNETEITELKTSLLNKKFEVEQLNTQMIFMRDTIRKKETKISTQTYEMNKGFYTCGTYKELKAEGLLTKEGGFIGLGKTESLTGNFPDSSFVQIDITIMKSISVDSKSAKLISEHPAGSYEFIRDKDKKIKSIEIKDPALFWKNSKYAVVEITK